MMKKEIVEKIVERVMRHVLKNDYSQDVINSLGELYDLSREAYLPDDENLRARLTFWPKRQNIESGGIQQVLNSVQKRLIFELNKKSDEKTLLQIARLYLAFLIQDLLFEKNPYEEKQLIKNSQILAKWFEYYRININFVTKDEIDTLFIIMRKI